MMSQHNNVRELLLAVIRLNRRLFDYEQQLLEMEGERDVQVSVSAILLPLLDTEGLTLSDLARNLRLKAPTVTVIANRLEEKGLIRRERGSSDRRQVHLFLTPSGKLKAEVLRRIRRKVFNQINSGVEKDRMLDAARTLNDVLTNLEDRIA